MRVNFLQNVGMINLGRQSYLRKNGAGKMKKIFWLTIMLALVYVALSHAQEDPFREVAMLAIANGKPINPSKDIPLKGFRDARLIADGKFLVSMRTYEDGTTVVGITSYEVKKIVMVGSNDKLSLYQIVVGNSSTSSPPDVNKSITSAYAKELCREFLEYWDGVKVPSLESFVLHEIEY